MEKKKLYMGAAAIGFVNGLFGAGGGMLAVPLLKKSGMGERLAHRSSLLLILPLTVFSVFLYYLDGKIALSNAFDYLIPGAVGALIGTFLIAKLPAKLLKGSFSLLLIYSGIRMLLK